MLKVDKTTYLSLLLKFILFKYYFILLSNNLWRSDFLLFLEFVDIVSILIFNFIEFIILLYTFFSNFFYSIQRIYDLPDFFFLCGFSFTNIHESQDCRGRGRHLFNSSLPLPPASRTLRHYPGDCCRELTSAHSEQRTRTGNLWFPSACH